MPLVTQFQRDNGELVSLHWGWWHLDCFHLAYEAEQGTEAPRLSSLTEYTYTDEHTYTDETDGEVLEIAVGDTFRWWRE